ITSRLDPQGALVQVLAGWSAARARQLQLALRPVPPAISAKALLDTGAEITCVESSLIQSLSLPFGGSVLAHVPAVGGLTAGALYPASVTIVHPSGNAAANLVIGNLSVLEVQLAALGYEALIGRDILARCRLLYDGPRQRFWLRY